jgi:hypothetical protein
MAFDIQVVRLLDVLPITGVAEAVGVVPRSVILTGDDFSSVEEVLLNGIPSPEFVAFQKTKIVAQVPPEIVAAAITDVFVLSSKLTLTQRSVVEFTYGTRPQTVTGILKLMQTFIRLLIRSPGSNVFHRRSGGGLFKKIGATIGAGTNRDRAAAEAAVSVNLTRQHIISVQTPLREIAPSERLLSANIVSLDSDPQNGALSMSVELLSHSGQRGLATIVR